MSWDTDLLSELVKDEFDAPLTDTEVQEKSEKAGYTEADDADDFEDDEDD